VLTLYAFLYNNKNPIQIKNMKRKQHLSFFDELQIDSENFLEVLMLK